MKTLLAAIAFALCTLSLSPVHAQDAGPQDAAVHADMSQVQSPAAVQDDLQEGATLVSKAVGAGSARDWRALGAALILLVVFLMRKVVGRYVKFFNTDRGGAVMALVVGVLGTVASLVSASGKFSVGMLMDGLMAAFTAAGGYATLKKLFSPSDIAPAPAAAK